jgi:predicted ArsR family transcriptional regulator
VDESGRTNRSSLKVIEGIKKIGNPSLSELSRELGISKTAVLKHVYSLERQGYVERTYVTTGRGRPICRISITENATGELQNIYQQIAQEALSFIEENFGCSIINRIMELRNEKLTVKYKKIFEQLDYTEMVKKLAEIRDREGYIAESDHISEGLYQLKEYNCPLIKIAEKYRSACEYERKFFEDLLGMDVSIIKTVFDDVHGCTFLIREKY